MKMQALSRTANTTIRRSRRRASTQREESRHDREEVLMNVYILPLYDGYAPSDTMFLFGDVRVAFGSGGHDSSSRRRWEGTHLAGRLSLQFFGSDDCMYSFLHIGDRLGPQDDRFGSAVIELGILRCILDLRPDPLPPGPFSIQVSLVFAVRFQKTCTSTTLDVGRESCRFVGPRKCQPISSRRPESNKGQDSWIEWHDHCGNGSLIQCPACMIR